jgi:hypothetical protein
MKLRVAFDSVGQFELYTRGFVDRRDYFELIVDGRRQKDEIALINPFATILSAYLKQTLSVARLEREDA